MTTIRLVLPMTNRGTCRSCGAAIDWHETLQGKAMPMNAGAVHLKTEGSGPNREVGLFDASESHWATCPAAASFRRR